MAAQICEIKTTATLVIPPPLNQFAVVFGLAPAELPAGAIMFSFINEAARYWPVLTASGHFELVVA
jgi:hypothetical protein